MYDSLHVTVYFVGLFMQGSRQSLGQAYSETVIRKKIILLIKCLLCNDAHNILSICFCLSLHLIWDLLLFQLQVSFACLFQATIYLFFYFVEVCCCHLCSHFTCPSIVYTSSDSRFDTKSIMLSFSEKNVIYFEYGFMYSNQLSLSSH